MPSAVRDRRAPPSMNDLARLRVREVQRGRLLTAAIEVVGEVGYRKMSTARVTERAGCTRKTFEELFTNREDCFLAAFDQALHRIASCASEAYAQPGSWREKVRAGLASMLQFIGDQPVSSALVIVEALGAGPRVLERRTQCLATLTHIIDQGRSEVTAGREPPPLTAEGLVGAVFSVLHARLLEADAGPPIELLGPLMSLIVLPYLGQTAAQEELERSILDVWQRPQEYLRDPLEGLDIRLTQRTFCVLGAIAEYPGASNFEIAAYAEIADQGQISRLLARLERLELIEKAGRSQAGRPANAWSLTVKGAEVQSAIEAQAGHARG
jgi:AcrR family transcriptional regulator